MSRCTEWVVIKLFLIERRMSWELTYPLLEDCDRRVYLEVVFGLFCCCLELLGSRAFGCKATEIEGSGVPGGVQCEDFGSCG